MDSHDEYEDDVVLVGCRIGDLYSEDRSGGESVRRSNGTQAFSTNGRRRRRRLCRTHSTWVNCNNFYILFTFCWLNDSICIVGYITLNDGFIGR